MTTSVSLCHSCDLLDRQRGRSCAAFPAGIPSTFIDDGEPHTTSLSGEPTYSLDETFAGSLAAWMAVTGRSLEESKHYGPGLHPGTKTPQAVHSRGVGGRQDGSTFRIDRFEPVSFLAKLLPDSDFDFHDVRADRAQGERVRDAYEALPAYDEDAVPAFLAMGKQVDDQFEILTKQLGVRVTFTDDEPYEDVVALVKDLRDNKHIAVLRTSATGGHPIFSNEQNDRFRAVHDAFGHGGTGRGFDRHGEEAAWAAHSRMFTGDARLAMTTETRGQNNAMVWGKGEFPEQKVALLPEFAYEEVSTSETKSADDDNLFHLSGVHHAALGRWGLEAKHDGPGPHDSGSPQQSHAGGLKTKLKRTAPRLVDDINIGDRIRTSRGLGHVTDTVLDYDRGDDAFDVEVELDTGDVFTMNLNRYDPAPPMPQVMSSPDADGPAWEGSSPNASVMAFAEAIHGKPLGEFTLQNGDKVDVTINITDGSANKVKGTLLSGDGTPVGSFLRQFKSDEQVYHASFNLADEKYKRAGIGKAFMEASMDQYVEQGVERITVSASSDGRMVWAKMGFDFEGHPDGGYPWRISKRLSAAYSMLENALSALDDYEDDSAGDEAWDDAIAELEENPALMDEVLLGIPRGDAGALRRRMDDLLPEVQTLTENSEYYGPGDLVDSTIGRWVLALGWSGEMRVRKNWGKSAEASETDGRTIYLTVESPDMEKKHDGPGPHSTGSPQAVHGGGGMQRSSFTAGLYAGLYEMKSIAALADEADAIFTSVLASGELSTKPTPDRPDRATPHALVETAKEMLVDLRVAASREASEASIGHIMGGGSSVYWLPRLTDLHGVAKDMEAKTFRNPLFLRALTASAEKAKEDAKEARLRSGKTSDRFPSPLSDTYTATAKSEVQQQVTDGWAARGWDPDDAGELHRGVGRMDSYLQSGETDEDHAGRLAAIAIRTWASTSNDSDRFSLAVQEAAVKEFGLDGHQGWPEPAPVLSDSASEVAQGTLRDMYDRTQEWFAERDITEVQLYRGQSEYALVDDTFDPIDLELGHEAPEDTFAMAGGLEPGDAAVRLRPLSSWSADRNTATGFTSQNGYVMYATIPVSRIMSHPRTGIGCLSEEECVVLGGTIGITWNRRE
jgi:hypothetical protein